MLPDRKEGTPNSARREPNAGFTLVEILIVVAILGILLGLLFIPLNASFHFVGTETAEIQVQDTTRNTLKTITGQLAQAMLVRTWPGNPAAGVPANTTRIDLLMPASADLNLPLYIPGATLGTATQPGQIWEVFFIGLADPTQPYNSVAALRSTGGLTISGNAANGPENQYILYRALFNPTDTLDPVTQANTARGAGFTVDVDPWFFDDSLSGVLSGTPVVPSVSNNGPGTYTSHQYLLQQMRSTAVYVLPPGATSHVAAGLNATPVGIPVGAGLTPVAVLGHLDAVRSRWDTAGNAGWIIDPRVSFLPAASQNEAVAPSEYGTQFQTSRGQWAANSTGAAVYWYDWVHLYQWSGSPVAGSASLDGTVVGANGQPMTITELNGPGTAPASATQPIPGRVISTVASVDPFYVDPRSGRITFTQFQVTEAIPVKLNSGFTSTQTVYPLYFPFGTDLTGGGITYDTTTFAPIVTTTGAAAGKLRPQVLPYSETVQILTNAPGFPGAGTPTTTTYQRTAGNLVATNINSRDANNPNLSEPAGAAYAAAAGQYPLGPGAYVINYTATPDFSQANEPFAATVYQPNPMGVATYNFGDEVPLVDLPLGLVNPTDPRYTGANIPVDANIWSYVGTGASWTGSIILVTYRFTFSTLDAAGTPLAKAAANYSSQQFVHVSIGFRKYDEQNVTPYDYSLTTDVGSANVGDTGQRVE